MSFKRKHSTEMCENSLYGERNEDDIHLKIEDDDDGDSSDEEGGDDFETASSVVNAESNCDESDTYSSAESEGAEEGLKWRCNDDGSREESLCRDSDDEEKLRSVVNEQEKELSNDSDEEKEVKLKVFRGTGSSSEKNVKDNIGQGDGGIFALSGDSEHTNARGSLVQVNRHHANKIGHYNKDLMRYVDKTEMQSSLQEDSEEGFVTEETVKKVVHNLKSGINNKIDEVAAGDIEDEKYPTPLSDDEEEDSSDEEDLRNTIGNIPLNWYDEYPHIGYNLDGKPLLKTKTGDKLDAFLRSVEEPDFYRTVVDKQTGAEVKLSDDDYKVISRIMSYKVPDSKYNLYEPWLDLYSHEALEMPLSGRPEHKRSFIPSKVERKKIARIVSAIRSGRWHSPKPKKKKYNYYDLWSSSVEFKQVGGIRHPLPAPKMTLPGHEESYNPPPEYVISKEDRLKLKEAIKKKEGLADEIREKLQRRVFRSARLIPAWKGFVQERYGRCLDLYMAPRKRQMRIIAKSEDFLPKLPSPRDLRPFPTMEEIVFLGHMSIIRTLSVHPLGKFLASGSDDQTVRIWEISTGRCLRIFEVEGAVRHVSWNPNSKLFLLAVVCDRNVVFINPETYLTDKVVVQQTNSIFKHEPDQGDYIPSDRVIAAVQWKKPTDEEWSKGYRLILTHFKPVKQIAWHRHGDYFATVIPEGESRSVLMHQLSHWRSQVPFSKNKGRVQTVVFHPKNPLLFVCTQIYVRVYNLQKQCLVKKVQANSRWISSLAVHPGGEHFIIGGYDRRLIWFETEYTKQPYFLKYHTKAVRSVAFHHKYPLFASCSDEGRVVVSHGMVYSDWLKNPLLVPLKDLRGHGKYDDLYVLDVVWHPYEPFLITAGADATIRLWR